MNHFSIKGLDLPSLMSTNRHKTTAQLLCDSTQPEHTSTNFKARFLFPLLKKAKATCVSTSTTTGKYVQLPFIPFYYKIKRFSDWSDMRTWKGEISSALFARQLLQRTDDRLQKEKRLQAFEYSWQRITRFYSRQWKLYYFQNITIWR